MEGNENKKIPGINPNEGITFKIARDEKNWKSLKVFVNGKEIDSFKIDKTLLESVFVIGWGDQYDFQGNFKNIEGILM